LIPKFRSGSSRSNAHNLLPHNNRDKEEDVITSVGWIISVSGVGLEYSVRCLRTFDGKYEGEAAGWIMGSVDGMGTGEWKHLTA
jgi:hypothetical protein